MKLQKQDNTQQVQTHRFMIFMDSSLQKEVDKLYLKQSRQYIDKSRIDKIGEIKDSVKGLREIMNEHQNHSSEIEGLKLQLQNQIKAILSKEQIIRNIEDTYMEQIDQIKQNYEQRQIDIVQESEQLKIKNAELIEINNKYLSQNDQLLKQNYTLQQRVNELEMKSILAEKNNVLLSQQLDQLKDIRSGSLIIQGAYKVLKQDFSQNTIYTLLTNKFKQQILQCLDPKDLFSLLLTSKQMYFIIQNNRQLMSYIVNYRTKQLNKEIKYLKTESNYFNDLVYQIPEEYVKTAIAKFLVFKFHVGQYMNDIFNDAYELVEGRLQSQQQQQQQEKQQQQLQSQNIESVYQNEDLLGLGETDEQQQQKSQISSTSINVQTVQSTANSLFNKFKSYTQNSNNNSNKNIAQSPTTTQQKNKSISDLSLQMLQDFKDIDSLIIESLEVPFLKAQIIQTRREMMELVKKSQQINQQLFQTGTKCVPTQNYQPKFTIQDFMFTIQKTFSRLIVNGHYLHLESQQLQQLCNYFAKLVLQQHKQICLLKSQLDDNNEELQSQKEMKYYIQDRAKIFEERIIKAEEQIFILSKQNYDQKQLIQQLSKREKELDEQNKEREQKIQTLGQAIKFIKQEKDQFESKLNQVMNNFRNMKLSLQRIV